MPPTPTPNPCWWIFTSPGVEGPFDHALFDLPNVGIYIRFRADRTGAIGSGNAAPPYAAAGVAPYDGDEGRYPAYIINEPGLSLAEREARAALAGLSLGKRSYDWIKCVRARYPAKPLSLFWHNFGHTRADGSSDYSNSVSWFRSSLDEMTDNGTVNASARRNSPFSAQARHLNRLITEAAVDFLASELSEDDINALVRLHWDVEEGYSPSSAMGTLGNGWLPALVRGTAHASDLARYESEVVLHDAAAPGGVGWTLKALYERDYDDLMAEIEAVPPGSSAAPATAGMLARGEPFDVEADWADFSNAVIRDWTSRSVFDLVRADAIDESVVQPFKAAFPHVQASEWGVCQSALALGDTTLRGGKSYAAGARAYFTNRWQRSHPLDANDLILYRAAVHPVGEFGPVYGAGEGGVFEGLAETMDDYPEAMVRDWAETARRAAAGSAKPLTPYIDFPGRSGPVSTFAGASLGTYARTNADWIAQNRALLEAPVGAAEIKVWNTLGAGAPYADYEAQYDTLASLIGQLVSELGDEWHFEDDFDRADGALGADWEATGIGGHDAFALVSGAASNPGSGLHASRLAEPPLDAGDAGGAGGAGGEPSPDMEAEITVDTLSGNSSVALVLRMQGGTSRDGIYFQRRNNGAWLDIVRRVGNNNTPLAQTTMSLSHPFTIRGRVAGGQLEMFVNGALVLSAEDAGPELAANTLVGVYGSGASVNSIGVASFVARDIGAGDPPEPTLGVVVDAGRVNGAAGVLYLVTDADPEGTLAVVDPADLAVAGASSGAQTLTPGAFTDLGPAPGGGAGGEGARRVSFAFTLAPGVEPGEAVTLDAEDGAIAGDPGQSLVGVEDFAIDNLTPASGAPRGRSRGRTRGRAVSMLMGGGQTL